MPDYHRLLEREVRRAQATKDEFAGRTLELMQYLRRSSGRFAATLDLLERAQAESPALELGADPWLFTQLLLEHGHEVVSAGQRPGVWREDGSPSSPQTISLRWADREHELEHHLFNVERDRWPFRDGVFRSVLCMEVLEHLVYSPAHLLYEANRVLADGGLLLVTTPNSLAAAKFARLARGRNIHGPYSGYGAHGRHNREFTPAEVRTVFEAGGFSVQVEAVNVAGYEADEPLGRALRFLAGFGWRSRRDHVLAVGRKVAPPRLVFSAGMYRSIDRERMRAEGVLLPDE